MRFLLFTFFLTSPLWAICTTNCNCDDFDISYQFITAQDTQIASSIDTGDMVAVWRVNVGGRSLLQYATKAGTSDDWFVGTAPVPTGPPNQQQFILNYIQSSVSNFKLLMDRMGNAIVVWQTTNFLGNTVIQAAYKSAGAVDFEKPGNPLFDQNNLSFFNVDISNFPIVVINEDFVVIAWQVFNGSDTVIQSSVKAAGDGLAGFPVATNPTFPGNFINYRLFGVHSPPVVYVDNQGDIAYSWQTFNGQLLVIQGAKQIYDDTILPPSYRPIERPGDPRNQSNILSCIQYNVVSQPEISMFRRVVADPNTTVATGVWKYFNAQFGETLVQYNIFSNGLP